MTQVTVTQLTDDDGSQLLHVKLHQTGTCVVTIHERATGASDHVWVHCDSNEFILPDDQNGVWPKEVIIAPNTHQGSFPVYGVKVGGGAQGLQDSPYVFLHGENACPNCPIFRRCAVTVENVQGEGTAHAIPILLVTPYPSSGDVTTGNQVTCVIEITPPASADLGDLNIAVDVSDRDAVTSSLGDWPCFLPFNNPNILAASLTLTVNPVQQDAVVQIFAYNDVPYAPLSPSAFQMTAISLKKNLPALRRRRSSR